MSEESGFWPIFGKFSAVVTTLGAIVATWMILSQTSEELELEIRSQEYFISPDLLDGASSNLTAFDYFASRAIVDKILPVDLEIDRESVALALANAHKESWKGFSRNSLTDHKGINFLELSNTGDKTATNIKIDIPTSGIATFRHPDKGSYTEQVSRVLSVDDLRAGKTAHITIWSNSHLGKYDLKKIDVTHETGVGSVSWPLEATGLSWFFAEFLFIGPLSLWLLFMFGLVMGSSGKGTKNQNESNGADEPTNT